MRASVDVLPGSLPILLVSIEQGRLASKENALAIFYKA